jgi:hypothetical protein
MSQKYSYAAVLESAEKIHWRVEDVIGGEKRLDFSRRFLPEALAGVELLGFLSRDERRILNQIRGNGYLRTFGLVEEFILPFVLDHARPHLAEDDVRTRALLRFAGEEAKHIHLFRRFAEEFARGFSSPCAVIGPADAIASRVLSHHPLGVALVILHLEWMTQRHYIESVTAGEDLDPQFMSLLRHHWMEEAQHAKLDALMVEAIADGCSEDEISRGLDDYLAIGAFLDGGLKQQAELDAASLQLATGRTLQEHERAELVRAQHQALRWSFLGSGMTHPKFLESVEAIRPAARRRFEEVALAFA